VGPTCQPDKGKEKKWVPVREMKIWAAGSFLCWAEPFPSALFLFFPFFFLFFFCFLYFFISFAKMLQINSNHFQKNSKNQCNDLTLQEN
jgi:hypothetical protein